MYPTISYSTTHDGLRIIATIHGRDHWWQVLLTPSARFLRRLPKQPKEDRFHDRLKGLTRTDYHDEWDPEESVEEARPIYDIRPAGDYERDDERDFMDSGDVWQVGEQEWDDQGDY